MCGRYTLIRLSDLQTKFPWIAPPDDGTARYNIAPTQPILAATNEAVGGQFKFDYLLWGLIPSWAKDPSIGNRMINARGETLAEKPSFRTAFRRRRCLVPADGFYEWRKEPDGTKTPMYIRMKDHQPFAFAGLWEEWHDRAGGGSAVRSCTIITTTPNALMSTMHDRMPVIIPPDRYREWLDPAEHAPTELASFIAPYPDDSMEAFPVSRTVNNPRNEVPDCIEAM